MARILQCLVCITVIMTSARTQRGYFYHQTYQTGVLNTENPFEQRGSQARSLQHHNIQISENQPRRIEGVFNTENPFEQPGPQARNLQHDTTPISENQSRRSEEARKQRIETRIPHDVQRIENGTYKILNRLQTKRGVLEKTLSSPNDRVVFPGPSSKTPSYEPEITEECRKKGYCDHVPNYPSELVNDLVAKIDPKLFKKEELDEQDIQIAQRLGGTGTDQEIELCYSDEQVIYPQLAPDKDDKWFTVINPPNNPVQGIRAETCKNINSGCNPIASFQEGYKAGCKQKYVYRVLEVLDENQNHVQKSLKLPSCCTCIITIKDPFSR